MRGAALGVFLPLQFLALAEPEYLLSSSAICPEGASYIATSDECRTAAEQLDLSDKSPESAGSLPDYPLGCYRGLLDSGAQLYFNSGGSDTSSVANVKVLCAWRAEPPEDEQLGYEGSCDPDAQGTDPDHLNIPVLDIADVPVGFPAAFDAREEWPFCFELAPRSQGGCGSCWAFATASVARQRACLQDCRANGRCDSTNLLGARQLSVQHIMGCSDPGSRRGCDGGLAHYAYESLVQSAVWEHELPYACGGGAVEDQFEGTTSVCTQWPWGTDTEEECGVENSYVDVTSYYQLPLAEGAEPADMMAAELAANGPLAVDFCVRQNLFAFWRSSPGRVYTTQDGCGLGGIIGGHMVMLVGYNSMQQDGSQVKYWIAQNSWGDSWGDGGYFYLERGVNLCGIENKASAVKVTVSAEIPPTTTGTTMTGTTVEEAQEQSTTSALSPAAEADNDTSLEDWILPFLISAVVFACCCWFVTGVAYCWEKRLRKKFQELHSRGLLSSPAGGAAPPPTLPGLKEGSSGAPPIAQPRGNPQLSAAVVGRPGPPAAVEVQAASPTPWPAQPPLAGAGAQPPGANPFREAQQHQRPWPLQPPAAGAGSLNPFRQQQQGGSGQFRPAARPAAGAGEAGGPGRGGAASEAADRSQSAPPWWYREPEAYVDNATTRMEQERNRSMY